MGVSQGSILSPLLFHTLMIFLMCLISLVPCCGDTVIFFFFIFFFCLAQILTQLITNLTQTYSIYTIGSRITIYT